MKYKVKNTILLLGFTLLCGILVFREHKLSQLDENLHNSNLLPQNTKIEKKALNLTGNAIVLYHISSEEYFPFVIKRLQFQDTSSIFKLSLQSIQGSLIQYYQQMISLDVENQLISYTPSQDLLSKPLLSLLITETELVDLDILIKAIRTAPNQISVEIDIMKGRDHKARFIAKFTPLKGKDTMLQQLKGTTLAFHLDYLSTDWKQKLDDYCLSKNLPFAIEDGKYLFSF